MKKYFLLLAIALGVIACKNQTQEEPVIDEASLQVISADYYYDGQAGVLLGKNFIYGVQINDKAKTLGKEIERIKKEPTDMVPVVVKAVIQKNENPEEIAWEEIATIAEIVSVGTKPSTPDVKLE